MCFKIVFRNLDSGELLLRHRLHITCVSLDVHVKSWGWLGEISRGYRASGDEREIMTCGPDQNLGQNSVGFCLFFSEIGETIRAEPCELARVKGNRSS